MFDKSGHILKASNPLRWSNEFSINDAIEDLNNYAGKDNMAVRSRIYVQGQVVDEDVEDSRAVMVQYLEAYAERDKQEAAQPGSLVSFVKKDISKLVAKVDVLETLNEET